MSNQTFTKVYTRDNCFILQELWDLGYSSDFSGNPNPYRPSQVNHLYDGAVEIWDNTESIRWFEDSLLQKNISDPQLFYREVKQYEGALEPLSTYLQKNHLSSVEELENFVSLLKTGNRGFQLFYHAALNEKTPTDIRDYALKLREKDAFYDIADKIIKATLAHLYPHTQGLGVGVLLNEITNPPSKEILEQRFNNCIMIVGEKPIMQTLTEFAKARPEFTFQFDTLPNKAEIKGQTAYPGIVVGKVRILRRKTQIYELEQGEILLSPMTTPDFIPAMKKAGAIVTDEGGITCHAGIVSRELHIPCITGTKVATQVFKDGDVVTVDATKGVIKKN